MCIRDRYNLFSISDILVTDYSSAFIDWLIVDRPIIFTPYDLEEYMEKNGLLDEYQKQVPPPICRSPDDIFTSLLESISDPDKYREERMAMKIKYLGKINKIINKLKDQNIDLKMIAGQWQLTII